MRTLFLTAVSAAVLATATPASANLISNGDFSGGTGSNFTSWTELFSVSNQGNGAGLGWAAGLQNLYGVVTQTFTVTTASLYEIAFDTTWRGTGLQYLGVLLTQGVGLNTVVPSSYTSGTEQAFTAFLNPGTYRLTFGGNDVSVDNVSVTAVPGPIAAAGLPGVLALMGYAAWRRRSKTAA